MQQARVRCDSEGNGSESNECRDAKPYPKAARLQTNRETSGEVLSLGTSTPLTGTNAEPQPALRVQSAPVHKRGNRACDAARR